MLRGTTVYISTLIQDAIPPLRRNHNCQTLTAAHVCYSSPPPDAGLPYSGNVGYDGGLLKVFRKYDDDHSGSITTNEMIMLVSFVAYTAARHRLPKTAQVLARFVEHQGMETD